MGRRIIYGLILCAAVAACLPDPLEVEGLPSVRPQIVVSSQIVLEPTPSLVVLLTKTFGALDASDDSDPEDLLAQIGVPDALVTLSRAGNIDTLVSLGNGVYLAAGVPLEPGDAYTLDVDSESLGKVSATASVMEQVSFDEISAELEFNGFDDTLAQVSYSIVDPAGDNYYMLNVQEVEREDFVENLLNPRAYTRLLRDTAFDGNTHAETFRVVPRDYHPGDTIAVTISNVSPEYFHFLQLRLDNRLNFLEYLSEPVNYPTNVAGGKGFFNLYVPDVRFFILEE